MSVREMFEKLGYQQTVDYDSIRYRHLTDYIDESVVFHTSNLFPKTYDITCLEWWDSKSDGWVTMEQRENNLKHCSTYGHWQKVNYGVDVSLHNAINKQIEELGGMMKIEIGMYARTKDGKIFKINSYNEQINNPLWMTVNSGIMSKGSIINASYNIIDLIEVGDYVNGELVEDITGEYLRINEQSHNKHYFSKYIKSIVTKEQFKEIEYRIGE